MNAENIRVAAKFSSTWQTAEPERIGQEILSVFNETHRQEDGFHIIIQDGKAIDPATGSVIRFETKTNLQKLEAVFFNQLISEADKRDSGSFVLISPLLSGMYPCNKAIHYQIAYTFEYPPKKILNGTAVLFDTPKNHCQQIAKKLDPSSKIKDAETLRSKLFICPEEFSLLNLLEIIGTNQSDSTPAPSQELINHFVRQIKSGRDPRLIALEMQEKGVLGDHSISCELPGIGVSTTLNFRGIEIMKCVECPFCHQIVDAVIKEGRIHCPRSECGKSLPYTKAN